MPKAVVLGAGMVGSVIGADLARDDEFTVTIADVSEDALSAAAARSEGRIRTVQADLSLPAVIRRIVADADIVLGALPSPLGLRALQAVIEAGRHYCDISFMPEDPAELNGLAKTRGVTAVVDCGVAPGLTNMLAGYAVAQLDGCQRLDIYVGGIPRRPRPPFYYKAAFSPADVIEEYTRPSRLVENGRVVVRDALSEVEPISFEGVGVLEAFNTDGLRSLIRTLDVPFMKEKTVRWPGHADIMRVFRETGLFSREPIIVHTVAVTPLEITSALLFPKWTYEPGEEDMTVLRVTAEASDRTLAWEMIDQYDAASGTSSMSRTTALPCAITARLIASGRFARRGVITPEQIGREPGLLEHVLGELAARGVQVRTVP